MTRQRASGPCTALLALIVLALLFSSTAFASDSYPYTNGAWTWSGTCTTNTYAVIYADGQKQCNYSGNAGTLVLPAPLSNVTVDVYFLGDLHGAVATLYAGPLIGPPTSVGTYNTYSTASPFGNVQKLWAGVAVPDGTQVLSISNTACGAPGGTGCNTGGNCSGAQACLFVNRIEVTGVNTYQAAPAWNAVYVCKAGTSPCDSSTSASSRGWSPASHSLVLSAELADTGAEPCDATLYELDGTRSVFIAGGLEYGTSISDTAVDAFDNSDPLHAGPYLLRCVGSTDPTLVTTWPLTLLYNGDQNGASGDPGVSLVPPGGTYDPTNDVGGTPLAAIFDAWDRLLKSYQVRAPFVFFQPAADFITNTKTNIDAAKATPTPGRYGSTGCPGYTISMPSPPVIHYTTPYGATASSQPWPSGQPLPSFTVLRCADFETIVSGWSWWHQARGLVDVGLYVGYGLFWLKRMQPRPSLNG